MPSIHGRSGRAESHRRGCGTPEEHLLRHVLGIVAVGQEAVADREHVALEPLDQLPAGSRVAGEAAADERGVGGHVGPSGGVYRVDAGGFQSEG